jgi:hypothetical protein
MDKFVGESGRLFGRRGLVMMMRTNINVEDNMIFNVDYCDTGSTLEFQNSVGSPMITLSCIPPAMLVRLRDALTQEIEKGSRKNCFEAR